MKYFTESAARKWTTASPHGFNALFDKPSNVLVEGHFSRFSWAFISIPGGHLEGRKINVSFHRNGQNGLLIVLLFDFLSPDRSLKLQTKTN